MIFQTNYQPSRYRPAYEGQRAPYDLTHNQICQAGEEVRTPSLTQNVLECRWNSLVDHAVDAKIRNEGQADSSLDLILTGKKELLRSKIEMLLIQLSQRQVIRQDILFGIDYDACRAQEILFEMGEHGYRLGKARMQCEKIKFDLEKQRRVEMASYFRDTAMLNKELKDTLIDYLKESQDAQLMGD